MQTGTSVPRFDGKISFEKVNLFLLSFIACLVISHDCPLTIDKAHCCVSIGFVVCSYQPETAHCCVGSCRLRKKEDCDVTIQRPALSWFECSHDCYVIKHRVNELCARQRVEAKKES